MFLVRMFALFVSVFVLAPGALGQGAYPTKPIRWVIPYAPGGGADVLARPVAVKLGELVGQQIVYENRGGGNSLIGSDLVAKSAPDGYTQLLACGATHLAPLIYDNMPYDPFKDYAPITNLAKTPNLLVTNSAFPAKNLAEVVAYGKANPGKLNWASSGNGSSGHLSLIIFSELAGIKVVHVPFKGAGPSSASVLGGQTDLVFAGSGVFLANIKAGKLRALAVGSPKRLAILADVQTFQESGYPGYETGFYCGLVAPAKTPRAIISRMHADLVKILTSPEEVKRFADIGSYPVANTPEQFEEELRQEFAKFGKVVREHNIKVD